MGLRITRVENCKLDFANHGEEVRELVGVQNGDAKKESVAHVTIKQNGASDAHYHPEAEETYAILAGTGRLVIDGQEIMVKKGDHIVIETKRVHQIFNDAAADLVFYCICAPAWKFEGFKIPQPDYSSGITCEIQSKRKTKEVAKQKLIGTADHAKLHKIGYHRVHEGKTVDKAAKDGERTYMVTKGRGKVVSNGQEQEVKAGDVIYVPDGVKHKFINDLSKKLCYYAVTARA